LNELFSSNQITLRLQQIDGHHYTFSLLERKIENAFDGNYEWEKFQVLSLGILWTGFNRSRNIFGYIGIIYFLLYKDKRRSLYSSFCFVRKKKKKEKMFKG
jgi:hypothetical protein